LDHTPLTITIPIKKQHADNHRHSIGKGSKKEKSFIKDLIKDISSIDVFNLSNIKSLENIVDSFAYVVEKA